MEVAPNAILNLKNLTISDGIGESDNVAGGIVNQGTLTVSNTTFLRNTGASFIFFGGARPS